MLTEEPRGLSLGDTITGVPTVTSAVAEYVPSVAVIATTPFATPVTIPDELPTVAIVTSAEL